MDLDSAIPEKGDDARAHDVHLDSTAPWKHGCGIPLLEAAGQRGLAYAGADQMLGSNSACSLVEHYPKGLRCCLLGAAMGKPTEASELLCSAPARERSETKEQRRSEEDETCVGLWVSGSHRCKTARGSVWERAKCSGFTASWLQTSSPMETGTMPMRDCIERHGW